jgi:alpha-tubulin suppressor-like RCC1 family protein
MSYTGIGATDPNHPLEVEGQVFISNVEAGSASQDVPFEVYSDYTGNSGLTDSRQLRLRVTPSATTTTNVHVDMGINNTDGDYFFISEPVTGVTTVGTKSTFTINQDGNVGVGSNLSVTGNVVTSNIVGGSPLTISTGSNVQILTSNVGIGTVVDPVSNTRVHIQGGSHASITNANVFPNFIFSRSENSSNNHVGGAHNTARHVVFPSEDGKVWAVGAGFNGALGLGDTTFRNVYTLVSALDGVANIVASSTSGYAGANNLEQTILLDDTGNVWACGANGEGRFGLGDTKDRYIPTIVTTNIYSGVSITEVSTGGSASLVLDSTGQIWGAGNNSDYRIGNLSGSTAGTNSTFIPTYPGTQGQYTFTSIDVGEECSLALEDNGRIWSTGSNTDGRAGQGGLSGVNGWTLCPDGTTTSPALSEVSITQICTGERHSMALDTTGNVWTTGDGTYGALGHGDTSDRLYFERVTSNVNRASGVTITKIAAGVNRSHLLDTNGRMWGSGWNTNGDFGQPPYVGGGTITTFIRADAGPIADKSVTDFALSNYSAVIARTSDNEYYVTGFAGSGAYGSMGTGDNVDRLFFTKLLDVNANPPPDYGYTRSLLLENTETGKGPSIELKNSDAVSSRIQMEDGASGKLNIGFVDASFDPKLSGGDGAVLEPFQERAQSNAMTRGVTINQAGGTMVAGGSTSNIGFNTPFVNSGLPGSAQYGYGGSLWMSPGTTFITTEGKVYFAGYNQYGQAGNGTTGIIYEWIESTPASSYPIVGWAQGNGFAQALDASGQIWVAGLNASGQLGVGDTTDRTTWTAVSGGGNQAVSATSSASYRITTNGTLQSTGTGSRYQSGTGSTTQNNSFVDALSGSMSGQKAKRIFAGAEYAHVIRSDDVLLAVGGNDDGELGVGSYTDPITTWTACDTTNFSGETPVQVSGGFGPSYHYHSMMITASGKIYGTGYGANYRTGLNTTVNKFTQCTGGIDSFTVTRVSTCEDASIALDSTGNVWITGIGVANGQLSESDSQVFTKVTLPAEFYSKTIVNVFGGPDNTFYAVDSEGTMWGVGTRVRGLGLSQADGYTSKLFSKVPIYDAVPKEFKYTPTLTLENPNPDYGATVEFKNPNNRAFINLDDKTSNLRLGFVNNEDNAGQFKGISISPSDNSVYFNQGLNLVAPGDEGINFRVPGASIDSYKSISKFIGIRNSDGTKMAGIDFTGENDGQKISFYTHDSGVSIGTRMTIADNGNVGIGVASPSAKLHIEEDTSELLKLVHSGTATIRLGIDGSGNFFIYNPSATGVYMPLNQNYWASNSDRRIKRGVVEMTNCLENISNIRPVYYNYQFDDDNQPRRIGFIAQEWQEYYPEIISTTTHPNYDFDVLGLGLTETIPVLLGAIKELKARIEALENA